MRHSEEDDGKLLGSNVGYCVCVGMVLGAKTGDDVGLSDGMEEGLVDGIILGATDGTALGINDGAAVHDEKNMSNSNTLSPDSNVIKVTSISSAFGSSFIAI